MEGVKGSPARTRETSRFWPVLTLIALAALAIRLVYAVAIAPGQIQPGDSRAYHLLATALAHGDGYTIENLLGEGEGPTASHPPLYPLYLSVFTKLGLTSFGVHRAISCLLGMAAVVLLGILGRRIAGPRVGLLAAGIGAVYPQLFMVDGTLVAEALYAPLIAATLILAYRALDRPTAMAWAALGASIGLATLTRSEAILLLPLLAAPLAWRARGRRLRLLAAGTAATVLVLSPWLVRNTLVFERFPLLSTNGALTQLATNCDETYYDTDTLGFVVHRCALRSPCLRLRKEVPQSECLAREAWQYMRENRGRVPVVVAARVGRLWSLVGQELDRSYAAIWARDPSLSKIGLATYVALVPLGAIGALALRRRGVSLLPLMAPFVLATLTAVIAFGFSRYRVAAEIPMVVLAAVGLETLALQRGSASTASRRRRGRATGQPVASSSRGQP